MEDIVIVGSGGFAREVIQLIDDINARQDQWHIRGLLDDNLTRQGMDIHGHRVIGTVDSLQQHADAHTAIAVGSPAARRLLHLRCLRLGHSRFATLVHPEARIGRHVTVGDGSIICCGSIITTDVRLGDQVIVNLACSIGHDVELGSYITLAPGVRVSGAVRIGHGVDVGTNAAMIQGITVGEWSALGAGAVAIGDVPDNATAVGVPASIVKTRPAGWHLLP